MKMEDEFIGEGTNLKVLLAKMDKTNEVAIGTSEKVHILNLMQWNS